MPRITKSSSPAKNDPSSTPRPAAQQQAEDDRPALAFSVDETLDPFVEMERESAPIQVKPRAVSRAMSPERARETEPTLTTATAMHPPSPTDPAAFSGLVDLASERLGGRALIANDDFFAAKENLLKPGKVIFLPDKYTERGKWMDGWETRRRRTPGYDWCIVKLGLAGAIRGIDIDTSHFLGNHPSYASIEVCNVAGDPDPETLESEAKWIEILPKAPLKAGSQNLFASVDAPRATHARLCIFPDGGVARLRLYGRVTPDWARFRSGEEVDLAAIEHGGAVVAASDMFFGSKENLIMPGRSSSMADGWETKRRRGPGYDWAVVQLGRPGLIRRVIVDTAYFKGNYPDRCSLEGCLSAEPLDAMTSNDADWKEIIMPTRLHADQEHTFDLGFAPIPAFNHVRLNIYPDGGVSRLRVFGAVAEK